MERQIILMIRLGRIEVSERDYLGDDWLGERLFLIELRDVVVGHLLLFVVRIEDRGPVLSSRVRALSIQLGRVVSDEKEDLQQIVIRDLRWIIRNLDGFGMSCRSG